MKEIGKSRYFLWRRLLKVYYIANGLKRCTIESYSVGTIFSSVAYVIPEIVAIRSWGGGGRRGTYTPRDLRKATYGKRVGYFSKKLIGQLDLL
jgi:hypothetical protein